MLTVAMFVIFCDQHNVQKKTKLRLFHRATFYCSVRPPMTCDTHARPLIVSLKMPQFVGGPGYVSPKMPLLADSHEGLSILFHSTNKETYPRSFPIDLRRHKTEAGDRRLTSGADRPHL
jgi:hypothetical protein